MVTYQYRCARDGVLDVRRPMGAAALDTACPVCGQSAVRVFSAPMLALAPRALVAALDRAEKTRDEPGVVAAPPPRPDARPPRVAPGDAARMLRLPRP
ncbi:MAG: hypothetical protein JWN35_680 [Frankiales bacterium]|nr:hypothetical protein [Frankiales bacterium]